MPIGKKADWLDPLILQYGNNYTCKKFRDKFAPGLSYSTISKRYKKLGIKPQKVIKTTEQRSAISNRVSKCLIPDNSIEYVKIWLNKKPRVEIASNLNISLYFVNKVIKKNNLIIDRDKQAEFQAEASKKHLYKAMRAYKEKIKNPEFRQRLSEIARDKSKRLWKDPLYRAKVIGGIRKAYEGTDFREKLSIINKERYKNDEAVRKILHAPRDFKNSKLNDLVAIKLDGLNVQYERESDCIRNYLVDFLIHIDDRKILLEVQSFWHTLPENIRNDRAKASIIKKYYPQCELKYIWENEIKSSRGNERLSEVLGLNKIEPVNISISDITFSRNSSVDITKFLTMFHYLGDTKRRKYTFTVDFHNMPIVLAVFGQCIRPNMAFGKTLELVRLCRSPYYNNKNLMSWFLSRCIKELKRSTNYEYLVSFADTALHDGAVYKSSNWSDCGLCQPDYQYMSYDGIPMHKKTLYNRAKKEGTKERIYAEKYGYTKTKTMPKRKFLYKLS